MITPQQVDKVVADYRQALIAELAGLRAYEHRYQCYDDPYCVPRGRQVMAELAAISTATEVAA